MLGAARSAERVEWRNSAEVRQELEGTIRLTWPSNPLRDSLDNLARARRVAIWLDRRIDPDQRVDFKTENVRLSDALRQLATQLGGGVCLIGPVVYIGPRESTANLFTASTKRREEAGKLPAEVRGKLGRAQPWQWEELAEPRSLLEELATGTGLKIVGSEQIPHDLWRAGDLPAMTAVDRLSLVLGGFDLTYEFSSDGAEVQLVPFPASAAIERVHLVKGDVRQFAEKLAGLYPKAKIELGVGRLTVTASAADHEQIAQLAKGDVKRPVAIPPGAKKVYTVTIEKKAVGAAAKALAAQMDLEVKFDPALTPQQLNEPVSFQVKDASFDALFEALLAPVGLTHKLDGKTLEISARKK